MAHESLNGSYVATRFKIKPWVFTLLPDDIHYWGGVATRVGSPGPVLGDYGRLVQELGGQDLG